MSSDRSRVSSEHFVDSILQSMPQVAVFDCDGTLWANNSGEEFFYWSMEQGLMSDQVEHWARLRYEDYRAGRVGEEQMCGEMTTVYAGLSVARLEKAAEVFFSTVVKPNYFEDMRRLTNALAKQGCALWAVSSTNEWVIREGIKEFGIPTANVLAASAECLNGTVTGKLTRMPSGEGKSKAIMEVIRIPVDAVFGNSVHDVAMLRLARKPYAVNPNPDLATIADEQCWEIYWPEAMRKANLR